VWVITAMMARSRNSTTDETSMPVSSAVASSEESTGVTPLLTEWRGCAPQKLNDTNAAQARRLYSW
jgi:hypothetical protein